MASKVRSNEDDKSMVEELIEAAKAGNLARIRYLVKTAGLSVNSRHPAEGPTPLYWAACNGYVGVCSWLVDHQADANFVLPKSGSTPLHAAADRGHYDCVLLLICSGANVNQQTTNNLDTSLHLAAYRGFASVCSLLVDHGADVFSLNRQNRTPLDEAYVAGKVDIVQMICRKQSELLNVNIRKSSSKSLADRRESFASTRRSSLDLHKSGQASKTSHRPSFHHHPHQQQQHHPPHPHPHPHHQHHQIKYPGIDIDDRIGIHQFDDKSSTCDDEDGDDDVTSSSRVKTSSSETTLSTSENKEISKILFSFHADLMEQVERLTDSSKEKDRELFQLRRENERLKEELRKYTGGGHRPH